MFLEILLFTFLGIILGVATGLIPGLHPNTVFVLVLSLSFLFTQFPLYCILAFIVSLSVCNTFTDFIPSILFGAPEEDTALSILPAHRMLLKGRGYEALFLTVIGGLGVTMFTILSFPFLIYSLPFLYNTIEPNIHIILMLIVAWMVLIERGIKKIHALMIFLLAGIFGFISLNSMPSDQLLFPALTGLFGFSGLAVSLFKKTKIPPQKENIKNIQGDWFKGSLTGWLAGLFAGILPGIGASQSGIIAARVLKAKTREFLTAMGGINTANIIFTFIAFYTLGKTRSGAVWTISQIIQEITFTDILIIITIAAITACISAILTLKIGKFIIKKMKNVSYMSANVSIIIFLIILVFLFTGFLGLLIALVGAFLGIFTILSGVKRTQLMGFLVFPTIMYFSGTNAMLLHFMGL